jgi:hypothetical protein
VPVAGAAEGACPNQAHTFGLPDCRAYELVTPPYSEGVPMQGLNGEFAVSLEGTRLIGTSAGTWVWAHIRPGSSAGCT